MTRRQDDISELILIFCVDVHMGLDPSPDHMRPPEPDPLPLRLDVINGWPHSTMPSDIWDDNKNIRKLLPGNEPKA